MKYIFFSRNAFVGIGDHLVTLASAFEYAKTNNKKLVISQNFIFPKEKTHKIKKIKNYIENILGIKKNLRRNVFADYFEIPEKIDGVKIINKKYINYLFFLFYILWILSKKLKINLNLQKKVIVSQTPHTINHEILEHFYKKIKLSKKLASEVNKFFSTFQTNKQTNKQTNNRAAYSVLS